MVLKVSKMLAGSRRILSWISFYHMLLFKIFFPFRLDSLKDVRNVFFGKQVLCN